jgi:hypothetical protein
MFNVHFLVSSSIKLAAFQASGSAGARHLKPYDFDPAHNANF